MSMPKEIEPCHCCEGLGCRFCEGTGVTEAKDAAVAGQAAQEWTPEMVIRIGREHGGHISIGLMAAENLATAINAAIDAERETAKTPLLLRIATLNNELAALRSKQQDSERLDWLSLDHEAGQALRHHLPWHDSLRSAVDAAMSQARQKGEG